MSSEDSKSTTAAVDSKELDNASVAAEAEHEATIKSLEAELAKLREQLAKRDAASTAATTSKTPQTAVQSQSSGSKKGADVDEEEEEDDDEEVCWMSSTANHSTKQKQSTTQFQTTPNQFCC